MKKVVCTLTGKDGNAFAVIGRVKSALREAEVSSEEIDKYLEEVVSGDYDNLLCVSMNTLEKHNIEYK